MTLEQWQQKLDNLDKVIASGVTSASYEGKSSSFRSLDDLLRERAFILKQMGQIGKHRAVIGVHNRGF